MGTEAYECVGGPLDGQIVRLATTNRGVFSKTEKLDDGQRFKHWYMLLTRMDTLNMRCVMFFSYRGTNRKRMLDYPIVAPVFGDKF
jgi:hypothetical protein